MCEIGRQLFLHDRISTDGDIDLFLNLKEHFNAISITDIALLKQLTYAIGFNEVTSFSFYSCGRTVV